MGEGLVYLREIIGRKDEDSFRKYIPISHERERTEDWE